MKTPPRISEAEWQVMKAVWAQPSASAQEIAERVGPRNRWSQATVKTLLNRLLKKGALRFAKEGKLYRYVAAYREEEHTTLEAESFLERFFSGGISPMLSHFVRSRELSAKELAELEAIIHQQKGRP